jgi:threonine/homoserine/homoserine lactone efflux protein
VLAVSARAAAFGFTHGMFTALGIVVGDIIFILVAVYGLVFIAAAMGEQFTLIKYVGGAYLIWLGISLWRADAKLRHSDEPRQSSWGSSFLSGLLITLGDQKAILFYLGFFPAFVDLERMTPIDTLLIILLAIVGVGGAKLVYAWLADRASLYAWLADRASLVFRNTGAIQWLNRFAACVMMLVGLGLLLKTQEWI